MIVDDSKAMVNTLTEILAANDYAVIGVSCGADALTAVEIEKPDLILLDIGMPGLDGFKTGSRLRQNELTKKIPIIMLTAHTAHEDFLRAVKEVQAEDFVPKPFRSDFLLGKIKNILNRSSHRQDGQTPSP